MYSSKELKLKAINNNNNNIKAVSEVVTDILSSFQSLIVDSALIE